MFPLVHGILSGQGGPEPLIWAEPQVVLNYRVEHDVEQSDHGVPALSMKSPGYATASYPGSTWSKATLNDQGISFDDLGIVSSNYGDPSASFRNREYFISSSQYWDIDGFPRISNVGPIPYPDIKETTSGLVISAGYRSNQTNPGTVRVYQSGGQYDTVWTQTKNVDDTYYNSYVICADELIYIWERPYLENEGNNRITVITDVGEIVDQFFLPETPPGSVPTKMIHNGVNHLVFISNISTSREISFSIFDLTTKTYVGSGTINYDSDMNNGWNYDILSLRSVGQDIAILTTGTTYMTLYVINMAETKPTYTSMSDVSNAWFGS